MIWFSEASGAMAKIPEFERKMPKNPGIKNFAYMSTFFLASNKYKHHMSALMDKNKKKINRLIISNKGVFDDFLNTFQAKD